MSCYQKQTESGLIHACGDLGPHCADHRCNWISGYLCDYPVGEDKTCDRPLCDDHAYEVAPEIHYCAPHYTEYMKFKNSGKQIKELENITPYKSHPND